VVQDCEDFGAGGNAGVAVRVVPTRQDGHRRGLDEGHQRVGVEEPDQDPAGTVLAGGAPVGAEHVPHAFGGLLHLQRSLPGGQA